MKNFFKESGSFLIVVLVLAVSIPAFLRISKYFGERKFISIPWGFSSLVWIPIGLLVGRYVQSEVKWLFPATAGLLHTIRFTALSMPLIHLPSKEMAGYIDWISIFSFFVAPMAYTAITVYLGDHLLKEKRIPLFTGITMLLTFMSLVGSILLLMYSSVRQDFIVSACIIFFFICLIAFSVLACKDIKQQNNTARV